MTLGPKPERTKPIADMSPEEYREWSEDLRTWLINRDKENAVIDPRVEEVKPRRVDHKGNVYPLAPSPRRQRGGTRTWGKASPEYMAQKKRESRARLRGEAL